MGWTILQQPPREGWQTYLDHAITGGDHTLSYRVAVSAIGVDGNYYAAVERTGSLAGRRIYAAVVLIEGSGYKMMSEDELPFYYAAPAEVLAAWWRQAKRHVHADYRASFEALLKRAEDWRLRP